MGTSWLLCFRYGYNSKKLYEGFENLTRTFLLQSSLPLVLLVTRGRIISILKMFKTLVYVLPAKRRGEQ